MQSTDTLSIVVAYAYDPAFARNFTVMSIPFFHKIFCSLAHIAGRFGDAHSVDKTRPTCAIAMKTLSRPGNQGSYEYSTAFIFPGLFFDFRCNFPFQPGA